MTLRRNTLITMAGQLAGVAISLTTVPLFLRVVGDARYGVLLIVWVILGYFALFDLGLGQATTQRMARLKEGTDAQRSDLLWTSLALNAAMGLSAALVLFFVARVLLERFFTIEPVLRAESLRALPWIAAALPISMFASTLSGALAGRERFAAQTLANTVSQALSQTLPLLVAWRFSTSLEYLIPAALLSRVVSAGVLLHLCRRAVPLRGPIRFQRSLVRGLFHYGGWVSVSAIVGPLMTSLDRLLIGAFAGAQAVTYYSVPLGLAGRMTMLPSSVAGAIFPRLAASNGERRDALVDSSVAVVAALMTPATVLALFLLRPFLALWLSPEFAASAAASGELIIVGVWANGLALIAHASLQAGGRPDLVAKIHLAELPFYFATLAGASMLWGVEGAAFAWTARIAIDAVLLFVVGGYARGAGTKVIFPAMIVLAAALFVLAFPSTVTVRAAAAVVCLFASIGWGWRHLAVWIPTRIWAKPSPR